MIIKSIRKTFKLNKRRGLRPRKRFFATSTGDFSQSTLGSGVKVVTWQSEAPLSTISLYVHAGSRFENYLTKGSTHFLKHLAFKANKHKYSLNLIRDVEEVGGHYYTTISRDVVGYHTHGRNDPATIKALAGTITSVISPQLYEWEFEEVKGIIEREHDKLRTDAETNSFEQLHRLAFRESGLGNNLFINEYDLKRLHPQHVQKHISDYYFPGNRMVVFGVGVPHDQLVAELQGLVDLKNESGSFELKAFDPLPPTPPTPQEGKYYGGEALIEGGKNTYVALGFPGVGLNSHDLFSFAVLKEVLGSFGISKLGEAPIGRISRTFSKTPQFIQASSFNISYVDNGLFGIFAEAKGGHAKELISALLNEIKNLNSITPEELSRAKAIAKGKLLRERECRINYGTSVANRLFGGTNALPLTNELQNIDQVSIEKVKGIIQKLTSTTPSLVTVGDIRGATKL